MAGGSLSSYSITIPEQNRPYFYSGIIILKNFISSKNIMHSGNLGKCILVVLESIRLILNTFLLTLFDSSSKMQEQIGFNGGKIFKKANGVGNSSHTVARSLSRNLKYSGNHKSKLYYLSPAPSIRRSNGKTLTGSKLPGLNLIMSDMANQSKSYCNYAQSRYISTDTEKYGISTLDATILQQTSNPLDE